MNGRAVVADIGGTNARFSLVNGEGDLEHLSIVQCQDFDGISDAFETFVGEHEIRVETAAFAVACPVDRDQIRLTNNHWSFSKKELLRALDLKRLLVINDFTAQSLAAVSVGRGAIEILQDGDPDPYAPILVTGPGTGLGVGGLVMTVDGRYIPLSTEGGHVTLPAQTEDEWVVLQALRKEFSHVSAERVISGPGLYLLYRTLCQINGQMPLVEETSRMVEARGSDPLVCRAFDLFSGFFGIVASDACLALGATQGVYIAGGVIPKLGDAFRRDLFLDRFKAKGRFNSYLSRVPIFLLTDTEAGLLGLVRALDIPELDRFCTCA